MLTKEISAGLVQWSARLSDARRRVGEAGPAEEATRIRHAAGCRREAFRYLAAVCGMLRGWPGAAQVGKEAVAAAHAIVLSCDAPEIRKVLPLITAAAQQYRIPAHLMAEATDALCVAERRPQVYGTVPGHPVADEARADSLRARVGLPALTPRTTLPSRSRVRTDEPGVRAVPGWSQEWVVLDGLLADLPPLASLPRTVRPTVGEHATWGCAYCGGAADPDAAQLQIGGRLWRVCPPCEQCPDLPQERLLDVLVAKGGLAYEIARAAAAIARHEGFRLPMRYQDPKARPNHRPQPRWHHIGVDAVETLVAFAAHRRPRVTPVAMPIQRARTVHDELLISAKAWAMLALPDDRRLSQAQIGKALQLAPATLDARGLRAKTVGELGAVIADPPSWLVDYHRRLAALRALNHARQTGVPQSTSATPRVPNPRRDTGTPSCDDGLAAPAASVPPPPRFTVDDRPIHPGLLVSARARRMLDAPAHTRLAPTRVAKALQYPNVTQTLLRRIGRITTVAALTTLMQDPPTWLLDFHAELARNRSAATSSAP